MKKLRFIFIFAILSLVFSTGIGMVSAFQSTGINYCRRECLCIEYHLRSRDFFYR